MCATVLVRPARLGRTSDLTRTGGRGSVTPSHIHHHRSYSRLSSFKSKSEIAARRRCRVTRRGCLTIEDFLTMQARSLEGLNEAKGKNYGHRTQSAALMGWTRLAQWKMSRSWKEGSCWRQGLNFQCVRRGSATSLWSTNPGTPCSSLETDTSRFIFSPWSSWTIVH